MSALDRVRAAREALSKSHRTLSKDGHWMFIQAAEEHLAQAEADLAREEKPAPSQVTTGPRATLLAADRTEQLGAASERVVPRPDLAALVAELRRCSTHPISDRPLADSALCAVKASLLCAAADSLEKEGAAVNNVPWRNHMMPDRWYLQLDPGIRFAVRVLHASGIETCQSCQGENGHAYSEPSVDIVAGTPGRAIGFAALAACAAYGLPVNAVLLVWPVFNGEPYECLWRVTFSQSMPELADNKPNFVRGYRAQ